MLRRRDLLAGAGGLALGAASTPAFALQPSLSAWDFALARAQQLAASPYVPAAPLPSQFPFLTYDAYRDVRFRPERGLWRDKNLPFQIQLFHRGWLFHDPVEIFEVADGAAQPVLYSPDLFSFGPRANGVADPTLGFAGFRIHAPINKAGLYDEVAAFLGASYFRAVAQGGVYGLSARALAIGSGDPVEEFPAFRRFYLERPAEDATSVVISAVLDSPSVAGAYRFVITPGVNTVFDVQAKLFPRTRIDAAGLAPLTSMYLYGPEQPRRFDDFRPQVHDSDGLLLADKTGARQWRPLANPPHETVSNFRDQGGGGFGLLQRQRRFEAYQDLETEYNRRPGCWVTPVNGFERGGVRLVELATATEGNDNIVAFWRPADPLMPGMRYDLAYSLFWGAEPAPPAPLARVIEWADGKTEDGARRRFVVDFVPSAGASPLPAVVPAINASAGVVQSVNVQPNAHSGGARLTFELDPQGATVSDLRAGLVDDGAPVSETWVYHWQA